jgi:hypothetical protein
MPLCTEAYWAVHNNTSQMKVFSWTEGSNLIYSRKVNVASWDDPSTTPYTSLTPDGQNWVSFLQGHVPADAPVGATVTGNNLWFAWTAPGAPGIPYTHIRLAHLNRTNFSVIKNDAIWNANYAYAYGFLNTNANGEVGMSYAWGGVTQYVNSARRTESAEREPVELQFEVCCLQGILVAAQGLRYQIRIGRGDSGPCRQGWGALITRRILGAKRPESALFK